jgi:nicotinamide-nucleotide amidase
MHELDPLASELGVALRRRGWLLATAESCTGGWVAQAVTAIPGSSAWFERGVISYSNQAKQDMLGVQAEILTRHGAVSEQTARAMAQGALAHSQAQISVAITGIAGPGGGSADKPVGLVWFGYAWPGGCKAEQRRFSGDRQAIRLQAVETALRGLLDILAG